MKQKNYDVQELYKGYMRSVIADPTAIDDILSGERQSVNTGARIKHSTGRMATVTAAAAVVAICAGIGLSNMNENDVDSKAAGKPETTLVTTVDQTKTNDVVPPAEQAAVSMSVNPIAVSERAFGIEIKLTAGNEEGKKVLKENAEKISSSLKVEKDGMIATAGSFFGADKLSGDSLTLRLFGNIFNKRIDTVPITIKLDSETPQAVIDALGSNSSATIYFKKTVEDKVFVSESGEHFWLSDIFATTDHNPTAPKLPPVILKLKDGTEVSTRDIGLTEGGNHGNGKINKQFTYVFDGKFQKGINNVASIIYDGVEFTPQGGIEKNIDEAKKAYIEATIEKQKLIKKNPNANTKEYDSAMIEAAKYIAQNKGSDILCAGLTSDKHFIAAACFSGNNAQKVKACADKMAQQGIRYNWFILIDKSGNELCKCYIDWCHMISGNAYVQIYSENAVSFAALPDGAVLRCLTDSSFADINVSLTDGDLGTTLFNNIKQ